MARKTGWNLINKGLNGREIPKIAIDVPDDIDILIVMLGTNDLLQGNDVDVVVSRMENFLMKLQFPAEKILLLGPVPMKKGAWVPEEIIAERSEELCQRYCELAMKLNIGYVNSADWGVTLTYDGIHYTEEGHFAFANGLHQYLTIR